MILNSFLVLSEIGNANFCVDREGGGGWERTVLFSVKRDLDPLFTTLVFIFRNISNSSHG